MEVKNENRKHVDNKELSILQKKGFLTKQYFNKLKGKHIFRMDNVVDAVEIQRQISGPRDPNDFHNRRNTQL